MSESTRIAKNTMFLYVRMFLIMGITLYTSRIVLRELGVSDYGIYNIVGGIVVLLGFFNSAMSSATQRYLSFDIGRGDLNQLKKTFSSTLTIHVAIAIIGLLLAETIGLWYINNMMVFPENRSYAVNVVYQFSVLTFLLNIIQVPYNALIIARERMNIYAYVSILEALLKVLIAFLLIYFGSDKLIFFSVLTFLVALIIRITYQIYCRKQFVESKYKFQYDSKYYKELISYSGWNLFGNVASIAKGQGVNIILNLFFGTVVNAAYGISNQVAGAVNLFVTNLQLAFNPQIIKKYSQGERDQTEKLIFQGSKISFFLLLILVMPILLNTNYILIIWLDEVPQHTVLFVQLALVGVLIESLSGTLITGAQATGKIKWYQIIIGTLIFLNLPISFFALKLNMEASYVFLISIVISIMSLIFRLFFLRVILRFNVKKYFNDVLLKTIIVSALMSGYYRMHNRYVLDKATFVSFFLDSFTVVTLLIVIIYVVVINQEEKAFLKNKILKKSIK